MGIHHLVPVKSLAAGDCAADDVIERARANLHVRIGHTRARIDVTPAPEPDALTDRELRRDLNAAETPNSPASTTTAPSTRPPASSCNTPVTEPAPAPVPRPGRRPDPPVPALAPVPDRVEPARRRRVRDTRRARSRLRRQRAPDTDRCPDERLHADEDAVRHVADELPLTMAPPCGPAMAPGEEVPHALFMRSAATGTMKKLLRCLSAPNSCLRRRAKFRTSWKSS